MIIKCFPLNDIGHNLDTVKAFTSNNLKILAFGNSKHYFIYFNNSLYNSSNIKGSIFHNTTKNYSFIYFSLSLSLSLSLMQPPSQPTIHHLHNQQPPNHHHLHYN